MVCCAYCGIVSQTANSIDLITVLTYARALLSLFLSLLSQFIIHKFNKYLNSHFLNLHVRAVLIYITFLSRYLANIRTTITIAD